MIGFSVAFGRAKWGYGIEYAPGFTLYFVRFGFGVAGIFAEHKVEHAGVTLEKEGHL